jgi:hypothetical protein
MCIGVIYVRGLLGALGGLPPPASPKFKINPRHMDGSQGYVQRQETLDLRYLCYYVTI